MGTAVVILTSGTSWAVPADFDKNNNNVYLIGGGGGGSCGNNGGSGLANDSGCGGGGAECRKLTNWDPGVQTTISYSVGTGGLGGVRVSGSANATGPSGADGIQTVWDSAGVNAIAKPGLKGVSAVRGTNGTPGTGGTGGSGGVGNNGGAGAQKSKNISTSLGPGVGGGGAGGPNGAGTDGQTGDTTNQLSGAGGNGDGGLGGAGGPATSTGANQTTNPGASGSNGTEIAGGIGSGGGSSGGASGTTIVAGLYGAGGGGGRGGPNAAFGANGCNGAQGVIIITYATNNVATTLFKLSLSESATLEFVITGNETLKKLSFSSSGILEAIGTVLSTLKINTIHGIIDSAVDATVSSQLLTINLDIETDLDFPGTINTSLKKLSPSDLVAVLEFISAFNISVKTINFLGRAGDIDILLSKLSPEVKAFLGDPAKVQDFNIIKLAGNYDLQTNINVKV